MYHCGFVYHRSFSKSGAEALKKRRIFSHFDDLVVCYKNSRQGRLGGANGLGNGFSRTVSELMRYSRVSVIGEVGCLPVLICIWSLLLLNALDLQMYPPGLMNYNVNHSSNIISSIEFDCTLSLFATAGVSKRIQLFDFATLASSQAEGDRNGSSTEIDTSPQAEMLNSSKLSCLSWSPTNEVHLASSDYEGLVTLWDSSTQQIVHQYDEHEKRVWSIHFSPMHSNLLVSGSDDGKVSGCTRYY